MTKKDMAKVIARETGLPQTQVKEILQKLFDGIIKFLVQEGRLELRNFGVFEIKRRKPRKARNPRTGEKVMVPAKNVATFKAGRIMEERVRIAAQDTSQSMQSSTQTADARQP